MADVCYDEDFPVRQARIPSSAVEPLPGQFDQRADSCAQCIQLLTGGERPTVAAAKIYVLEGELTAADMDKIRGYLINPVDTREASMDKPSTLKVEYAIPTSVASVVGFTHMDEAALSDMLHHMGLAMDLDDLKFLQTYFRDTEKRDPTITESPHGRHLLVRPLPPHHLPHPDRRRKVRGPDGSGRLRPLHGCASRSTARRRLPSVR